MTVLCEGIGIVGIVNDWLMTLLLMMTWYRDIDDEVLLLLLLLIPLCHCRDGNSMTWYSIFSNIHSVMLLKYWHCDPTCWCYYSPEPVMTLLMTTGIIGTAWPIDPVFIVSIGIRYWIVDIPLLFSFYYPFHWYYWNYLHWPSTLLILLIFSRRWHSIPLLMLPLQFIPHSLWPSTDPWPVDTHVAYYSVLLSILLVFSFDIWYSILILLVTDVILRPLMVPIQLHDDVDTIVCWYSFRWFPVVILLFTCDTFLMLLMTSIVLLLLFWWLSVLHYLFLTIVDHRYSLLIVVVDAIPHSDLTTLVFITFLFHCHGLPLLHSRYHSLPRSLHVRCTTTFPRWSLCSMPDFPFVGPSDLHCGAVHLDSLLFLGVATFPHILFLPIPVTTQIPGCRFWRPLTTLHLVFTTLQAFPLFPSPIPDYIPLLPNLFHHWLLMLQCCCCPISLLTSPYDTHSIHITYLSGRECTHWCHVVLWPICSSM